MKKIIFLAIVFVIFYACVLMSNKLVASGSSYESATFMAGTANTLLIFILYNVLKRNDTIDNFTFEVSEQKKCQGGPYMYSSDPELTEKCSKYSNEELAQYNCPSGYNGRPVHFDYTPMSDSLWENKMCDSVNYDTPCVL